MPYSRCDPVSPQQRKIISHTVCTSLCTARELYWFTFSLLFTRTLGGKIQDISYKTLISSSLSTTCISSLGVLCFRFLSSLASGVFSSLTNPRLFFLFVFCFVFICSCLTCQVHIFCTQTSWDFLCKGIQQRHHREAVIIKRDWCIMLFWEDIAVC